MSIALRLLLLFLFPLSCFAARVETGIDRLFSSEYQSIVVGKRVGLITNQTGIDRDLCSTIERLKKGGCHLVALFAPEHGLDGATPADVAVPSKSQQGIPLYSLYGETRRPTEEMLRGIDLLIYDIQDVGVRCYTYPSTLYYAMEEAAKRGLKMVVLDRPNPINGVTVDGPMLDADYRSFIGYIDIPFVHGMTIGELARYFNAEYQIGCPLTVVPMKGWRRTMTFRETGLPWVPTSPMIPEPDTPLYYASTSMVGEIAGTVSVGIGTATPFKVVGAPWIDGDQYAKELNKQNFPGVQFHPYSFHPFFGRHKEKLCRGVRLVVTDSTLYRPVATQYLMIGLLKSLYPTQFQEGWKLATQRKELVYKMFGSDKIAQIIEKEQYITWNLIESESKRRDAFLKKRAKYLLY